MGWDGMGWDGMGWDGMFGGLPHGEDEVVVFAVEVLEAIFPDLEQDVGVGPAAAVGHVGDED